MSFNLLCENLLFVDPKSQIWFTSGSGHLYCLFFYRFASLLTFFVPTSCLVLYVYIVDKRVIY